MIDKLDKVFVVDGYHYNTMQVFPGWLLEKKQSTSNVLLHDTGEGDYYVNVTENSRIFPLEKDAEEYINSAKGEKNAEEQVYRTLAKVLDRQLQEDWELWDVRVTSSAYNVVATLSLNKENLATIIQNMEEGKNDLS